MDIDFDLVRFSRAFDDALRFHQKAQEAGYETPGGRQCCLRYEACLDSMHRVCAASATPAERIAGLDGFVGAYRNFYEVLRPLHDEMIDALPASQAMAHAALTVSLSNVFDMAFAADLLAKEPGAHKAYRALTPQLGGLMLTHAREIVVVHSKPAFPVALAVGVRGAWLHNSYAQGAQAGDVFSKDMSSLRLLLRTIQMSDGTFQLTDPGVRKDIMEMTRWASCGASVRKKFGLPRYLSLG